MTIETIRSRFIRYSIIILLAFFAGWLFHMLIIPLLQKPLIGTCENTDVGVISGSPKQYMLTADGMIEQDFSSTSLSAGNYVLIDTFGYATTRFILLKDHANICGDCVQAVKKDEVRSVMRTFSVSDYSFIVSLEDRIWHVYRVK